MYDKKHKIYIPVWKRFLLEFLSNLERTTH